jgi:hypothetical protein
MNGIDRRTAIKVTGAAGIAFPVGAAQDLLTTSGARAQASPPRLGTWPNRRLLDRLKIEHPTSRPQWEATSPLTCRRPFPSRVVLGHFRLLC